MLREMAENNIWFGEGGQGVPRIKRFLSDTRQGITPSTLWLAEDAGANEQAKKEVSDLFSGDIVFDSPKPTRLIQRMLNITTESMDQDLVLDFFAGSGTTGAVAERLGFSQEGILRQTDRLHDRYVDSVFYGLLVDEWNARAEHAKAAR